MELTFDKAFNETKTSPEHLAIPRTSARPVVRIWSVATTEVNARSLREHLFDLLPVYWSSRGILDCKILEDRLRHSFIIIESWLDQKSQRQFQESASWQEALKGIKARRHITLKEITNNIFELIE